MTDPNHTDSNETPTGELPDESLDEVTGGSNYVGVSYYAQHFPVPPPTS